MKNINVKRAVAGAAALALAAGGLAVAFAANTGGTNFGAVAKGDIYNNGMPTATIVIGSNALPADTVWAANIAAAIAQKAYVTTTHTIETPGTEGSTSVEVTGDGLLADNYVINAAATAKVLDYQDYPLLYKKDVSTDSTYTGASTLTISDELSVTADVKFNKTKNVKDLVASVDKGSIVYTVDLDEGIKNTYTNASASPRLKFNVMGKQYTVDSFDGTTLKLIQNIGTQAYNVGDTFAAGDYTIKVTAIRDTGADTSRYEVELELLNASGTVVSTDVFKTGDTTIFDEFLDVTVDVDTVYSDSVKLITGSSGKLELTDGDKVQDFPAKGDELWKADFTYTSPYLLSFSLTTDDSSLRFTNDDALRIGDKITMPLDFGSITFLGLTEEKMSEFTIQDNYIDFTDADRKDHTLFLSDIDEASTARDTYETPELDGDTIYIKFYTSSSAGDANFTAQLNNSSGKYLIGGLGTTPTWGNTQTFYTTGSGDLNADTVGIAYPLTIPYPNNEDKYVNYTLALAPGATNVYSTVKTVAVGLTDAQTTPLYIGDTDYRWNVAGVDISGSNASAFTDGATFIGERAVAGTLDDMLAIDQEYQSIARIDVYNTTDTAIYSYIDAYTGDMVNTDDSTFTDTYEQMDYTDGTNTWSLSDEGRDADLEFAYTTFGAKASIADGYPLMNLPEQQLKGQIFIGNPTVTTTTGGTEAGEDTYTTTTPANFNPMNLVKTDASAVAGTKIVVGGQIVNTLAEGITNSYLTQSGDYVMGKYTNGNIYVAGWTADDTGVATQAFITALSAMQ